MGASVSECQMRYSNLRSSANAPVQKPQTGKESPAIYRRYRRSIQSQVMAAESQIYALSGRLRKPDQASPLAADLSEQFQLSGLQLNVNMVTMPLRAASIFAATHVISRGVDLITFFRQLWSGQSLCQIFCAGFVGYLAARSTVFLLQTALPRFYALFEPTEPKANKQIGLVSSRLQLTATRVAVILYVAASAACTTNWTLIASGFRPYYHILPQWSDIIKLSYGSIPIFGCSMGIAIARESMYIFISRQLSEPLHLSKQSSITRALSIPALNRSARRALSIIHSTSTLIVDIVTEPLECILSRLILQYALSAHLCQYNDPSLVTSVFGYGTNTSLEIQIIVLYCLAQFTLFQGTFALNEWLLLKEQPPTVTPPSTLLDLMTNDIVHPALESIH